MVTLPCSSATTLVDVRASQHHTSRRPQPTFTDRSWLAVPENMCIMKVIGRLTGDGK